MALRLPRKGELSRIFKNFMPGMEIAVESGGSARRQRGGQAERPRLLARRGLSTAPLGQAPRLACR
jgi:hypothetical protein